jgi:hypothetical protein
VTRFDQAGVVSRYFDDLDAVLEFDALDDFGQPTCDHSRGRVRGLNFEHT